MSLQHLQNEDYRQTFLSIDFNVKIQFFKTLYNPCEGMKSISAKNTYGVFIFFNPTFLSILIG